jgi:hypothetical protein
VHDHPHDDLHLASASHDHVHPGHDKEAHDHAH